MPEFSAAAVTPSRPSEAQSYFWPGTKVLKNKWGITDEKSLLLVERLHTSLQGERIAAGLIPIERTFDAEHLKAVHKALVGDLYSWGGEYRTVSMRRGVNRFAEVPQIPALLDRMHEQITEIDWATDKPEVFATNMAAVFTTQNFAHSFRDGNGRVARIVLNHVAEMSPYRLDFTRIEPQVWNQRSALTMPDRGSMRVHPEEIVGVFTALTVEVGRSQDDNGLEP